MGEALAWLAVVWAVLAWATAVLLLSHWAHRRYGPGNQEGAPHDHARD